MCSRRISSRSSRGCNTRALSLTTAAGLPADSPGLLEAAKLGAGEAGELVQPVDIDPGNKVFLLPAGSLPEGDAVVTSGALRHIVSGPGGQYGLVLIDAPAPAQEYVASAFGGLADGVVVVVKRNSPVAQLERLQQVLALKHATLTGYIYTFARPA